MNERKNRLSTGMFAATFAIYVITLLVSDDIRAQGRRIQESYRLRKIDLFDAVDIRSRIRKPVESTVQDEQETVDVYRWEAFLRTFDLTLVTDNEGKYVSSKMSSHIKIVPMLIIIIPLLLFLYAIIFHR